MVKTKGITATMDNYRGAVGRVPAAYKAGVEAATDWQANALAADQLYREKLQESFANNSRSRGIQRVSDAEWKRAASEKGASRIGAGMNASMAKYQQAMAEVLSVIEGVSLAPRTADPIANVDGRVKPIVQALSDYRRSR